MEQTKGTPETITPHRPRFGLRALFYWTAVLVVCIGWVGVSGLWLVFMVAADHCGLVARQRGWSPWATPLSYLVVAAAFIALVDVVVPHLEMARGQSRMYGSASNLAHIALAARGYENSVGHLPPVVTRSETNEPLHSWRTALLPPLEHGPLWDRIDKDAAWDSERNSDVDRGGALQDVEMECFYSPRMWDTRWDLTETHYFAVVGPETVWGDGDSRRLADVTDDPAETIFLIETDRLGAKWCEPRDLAMDEAIDLLMGAAPAPAGEQGSTPPITPLLVAFADGHCDTLSPIADRATARALLTRAGGEEVNLRQIAQRRFEPYSPIRALRENAIPLTLFALLAVAPRFDRVWRFIYG